MRHLCTYAVAFGIGSMPMLTAHPAHAGTFSELTEGVTQVVAGGWPGAVYPESDDWVPIPRASTTEGMSEIQTFIDTETDESFQAELTAALSDPIPFRAFMMALVGKADAKKRWSDIREDGISARMHAFCASNDITINDERF